MNRRQQGARGEAIAARFLLSRGYKIVAQGWRCKTGEIDIVAAKDGALIFVEVKFRMNRNYGTPEESVGWHKRQRLRSAVFAYLSQQGTRCREWRIDVIAIERKNGELVLRHLQHAVGAE